MLLCKNHRHISFTVFSLFFLGACATFQSPAARYIQDVSPTIDSTNDICRQVTAVADILGIDIAALQDQGGLAEMRLGIGTSNTSVLLQSGPVAASRWSCSHVSSKSYPQLLTQMHRYFCGNPYYYISVSGSWSDGRPRRFFHFLNDNEISSDLANVVKPADAMSVDHVAPCFINIESSVAKNNELFISQISTAKTNEPLRLRFVVEYPETEGMVRSAARDKRRRHLQGEMTKIVRYIELIPYMSDEVGRFMDEYIPGPLSVEDVARPRERYNAFRERYQLDYMSQASRGLTREHYYYYGDIGFPESRSLKDVLVESLVNSKYLRYDVLGRLFMAESHWVLKRETQGKISIEVLVDIPKILDRYRFTKIDDLVERN